MGLSSADGSQKIVIFSNALIRFVQLVIAAATIGAYSQQKGYWHDHDIPNRIVCSRSHHVLLRQDTDHITGL